MFEQRITLGASCSATLADDLLVLKEPQNIPWTTGRVGTSCVCSFICIFCRVGSTCIRRGATEVPWGARETRRTFCPMIMPLWWWSSFIAIGAVYLLPLLFHMMCHSPMDANIGGLIHFRGLWEGFTQKSLWNLQFRGANPCCFRAKILRNQSTNSRIITWE